MRAMKVFLPVVAAGVVFGGCAASDNAGITGDCIILANGGNKLCGEDAKAWCQTTEKLREGDAALGIEADTESQAVCAGL